MVDSTKEAEAEAVSRIAEDQEVSVTKEEPTTTDKAVIETTVMTTMAEMILIETVDVLITITQIVGQTAADMVTLVMRSVMVAGMEVTEMTGAETTMVVEATGETTTIVVVMGATGDTEEEVLEEWQVVVENTVIVTEEKNQFKALHHLVWPNEMLVDLS